MTFVNANAVEVRESIRQCVIYRGMALKFVKNEINIIMVKCEDQYLFVLSVSKDTFNPILVIKTLVSNDSCYRIFTNPRVLVRFLAKHYKSRILDKH